MSESDQEGPIEDLGFGRDDQPNDDLEVSRELEDTVAIHADPGERGSGGGGRWLLVLVALLVVVGGVWWLLARSPDVPKPVSQEAPPESPATTAEGPLGAAVETLDPLVIPDLDASDEVVRQLVARLSSEPGLGEWLATDRLVRRFVVTMVNISEGVHPRKHLPIRDIEGAYVTERVAGVRYPDPSGYDRYRSMVAVFLSVDTEGAAELYTRLRPLFAQAYRDLGYPRGDFDTAMRGAIQRLVDVPVPEAPPALVQGVGRWHYEDPTLESLSAIEKQLLRLGPSQQRAVRQHLLRLGQALGMDGL